MDSDYAESDKASSKSRTGYVFMIAGGPVVWKSALQPVVAQSSCEAEYVAANAAARTAEWVRLINDDLGVGELLADPVDLEGAQAGKRPVLLWCDNQATIALSKNFMVSHATKHIRVRFHYIRQQIRDGIIRLQYVPTDVNLADCFTKCLAYVKFAQHRDLLVKEPIGLARK